MLRTQSACLLSAILIFALVSATSAFRQLTSYSNSSSSSSQAPICPDYFQHIHSDFEPWRSKGGIRLLSVEKTEAAAHFRAQIIEGKLYVRQYKPCVQSRLNFTVWGLLQLLERYPGRIPDVDFMFNCMDQPLLVRNRYTDDPDPPIIFKYCSNANHIDIVWPDFSFWGWPEVYIRQWDITVDKIMQGTGGIPWKERASYGQWKGTIWVAPHIRAPVVLCNDEPEHRWRVVTEEQKWHKVTDVRSAALENQCAYRYKIYAEGAAWSVSMKYIMACGSTVLFIRPFFYEFFARGLVSGKHFLPVPVAWEGPMCEVFKVREKGPCVRKALSACPCCMGRAHVRSFQGKREGA
eukprot:TRINITY_DN6754_c0_g1_i2.p1 TRINITY_DN6754_c0_g1~~TRINITY_DN6754_c0_g1_i2.p1  ORF type:complete len:350 (+),score=41.19 TRINITY_DN6754_c0_g1_i2:555-1604(+)